ncbi:MAG: alanine racemase, partial [Ktedonobacteraceae bacterium]|nr:alanine racemase [Ktedonobacteraceae bacterium]
MIHLHHLLEATHGALSQAGQQTQFQAFSHDTRQIAPEELFVAIRGARGDGHDYLLDAVRLGATGLLVEARRYNALSEKTHTLLAESAVAIILVEDTRRALQQYARYILARWHPMVIAVTGSVGKTSTKEAIADVLAARFATFRSWQNYNDLLGIPLSLGRLEAQHEYAVMELGCDHPGEIADLCRIIQPQIGVLTSISPVRLQYFNSLERLATEMGTLLSSLPAGGRFFYNQDDAAIRELVSQYSQEPEPEATLHPFVAPFAQVAEIEMNETGLCGRLVAEEGNLQTEIELRSQLLGEHHLNTMLAAYQVARSQGMSEAEIRWALERTVPLPGRLNPLPGIRGSRLLDDTHNAAPASMSAGLRTLHALTPDSGRRIAVLGDMLNLGHYTEEAHRQLGEQAAGQVDYLVLRGEQASTVAEAARQAGLDQARIIITSTHEDAARIVRNILEEPVEEVEAAADVVLIKGSEETRMERVSEMLMAHPWQAPEKLVRQTPGWKKTIFRQADRPTWVEIDLNAIGNNVRHIKAMVGENVRVLVSLKADAYGHGALRVAHTALHNGASMLGVATVSEAIPLREAGISAPILVFGYVPRWQMREAVRLGVTVTLYASELAQELARAAQELGKIVKVHVKVDTGMARLGIRAEQVGNLIELIEEIKELPGLELEGLYTHFATADGGDQEYAHLQLTRFQEVLRELEEHQLRPPIVHAANS